MHSQNEGAFFVLCACDFVKNCGCFLSKNCPSKIWLLIGLSKQHFLTHVLSFLRVFSTKTGAKVVQKCSQNVFVITQNQWKNGSKSMCKKQYKFARYSHLEIQQKSVQIGHTNNPKLAQKWCKQSKTFAQNKMSKLCRKPMQNLHKSKKKSREISRLSLCLDVVFIAIIQLLVGL